jgi:hypothetical protein
LPRTEGEATGSAKRERAALADPCVTHVDYSAAIQTVRRETHPGYYDIIEAFRRRTGCPVIVNTSFNVRGEPLVCTPEDAYRCFMRTNMDALVWKTSFSKKLSNSLFLQRTYGSGNSLSTDTPRLLDGPAGGAARRDRAWCTMGVSRRVTAESASRCATG